MKSVSRWRNNRIFRYITFQRYIGAGQNDFIFRLVATLLNSFGTAGAVVGIQERSALIAAPFIVMAVTGVIALCWGWAWDRVGGFDKQHYWASWKNPMARAYLDALRALLEDRGIADKVDWPEIPEPKENKECK